MKRRQKVRKGIILFAFFLFPIVFYYFSPALSIIASSEGIVSVSLIMFALMFLSALFSGGRFVAGSVPLLAVRWLFSWPGTKK